jgi:DNA-3-methyladenine glycosylase II
MYDKALAHFKKSDPILYKASIAIEFQEINPVANHFLKLVRSIIGQQLSVKAASTIFSRFEKLFPKEKITPERILKMDKEKIRSCGVSYSKIEYIKDLSKKVVDKNLDLANIDTLDNKTVIEKLTMVKGIGPWSAEMFLMFSLARPDVFSTGDLGLKNAIKKLYKIDKISNEDLITISAKWSPYRTYACMILWQSLDNEPK